jgi:outer membrane protein assembly factor BamB
MFQALLSLDRPTDFWKAFLELVRESSFRDYRKIEKRRAELEKEMDVRLDEEVLPSLGSELSAAILDFSEGEPDTFLAAKLRDATAARVWVRKVETRLLEEIRFRFPRLTPHPDGVFAESNGSQALFLRRKERGDRIGLEPTLRLMALRWTSPPRLMGPYLLFSTASGQIEAKKLDGTADGWSRRIDGRTVLVPNQHDAGKESAEKEIAGRQIFYTSTVDGKRTLVGALGVQDGRTQWEREFPAKLDSAPLLTEKSVVLHRGGRLEALSRGDGSTLWQFEPKDGALAVLGGTADRLFLRCGREILCALEARSGRSLWKVKMANLDGASVLGTTPDLYLGTKDGSILAIAARDGRLLWRLGPERKPVAVVAVPDLLYLVEEKAVAALAPRTGREFWRFEGNEPVSHYRSHGKSLFAAFGRSRIACFGLQGKRILWHADLDSPVVDLTALPDGPLLASTKDGCIRLLDPENGSEQGRYAGKEPVRLTIQGTDVTELLGGTLYYAFLGEHLVAASNLKTMTRLIRPGKGGGSPIENRDTVSEEGPVKGEAAIEEGPANEEILAPRLAEKPKLLLRLDLAELYRKARRAPNPDVRRNFREAQALLRPYQELTATLSYSGRDMTIDFRLMEKKK